MSYCVNCGVELAPGEKCCPLCATEVVNPRQPYNPNAVRPYPRQFEAITKKADRRFFALFASLFLLIPVFTTLVCNLLVSKELTWSLYVLGACMVLFIFFVFPFYFEKRSSSLFFLADMLVILVYLSMIELLTFKHWFLPLGLPLTLSVCGTAILIIIVCGKKNLGFFVKSALVVFAAAFLTVLINISVNLYLAKEWLPSWSLYCLAPCILIGFACLILERRKSLREKIRRRLFI